MAVLRRLTSGEAEKGFGSRGKRGPGKIGERVTEGRTGAYAETETLIGTLAGTGKGEMTEGENPIEETGTPEGTMDGTVKGTLAKAGKAQKPQLRVQLLAFAAHLTVSSFSTSDLEAFFCPSPLVKCS